MGRTSPGLTEVSPFRIRRPALPALGGSWPGRLFAGLAFVVGFVLGPLQIVGTDFGCLPGDVVDNRLNNYVLEHGYRWTNGQEPAFWHARFCYPAKWMTARSDAHLGNLPIYSIFRAAGAGPERAFQLWWLTTFGLNFASAVWAARRLGVGWVGAAVAAYVFAFGLPVSASLPHAQLAPRYFVPPAVAFAWAFLARPSWRSMAVVAGCLVAQTYCTVYVGYFLALLLAAVGVAGMIGSGWCVSRTLLPAHRELAARVGVVAVAVAAVAPLARPHLTAGRESYPTSPRVVIQLTPKPTDWVRPASTAGAWGWLARATDGSPDRGPPFALFPGGFAVAGLIGGIGAAVARRGRRRTSNAFRLAAGMTIAVLLVAALTLRLDTWSPYQLVVELPGVSGVRAVFRIVLVLLFPLGVLAGLAASAVVSAAARVGGSWGHAVASAGVLVAVVADHHVRPPTEVGGMGRYAIAEAVARREALAAAVRAAGPATAFYVFPGGYRGGVKPLAVHVDAMWASLDTGVPTANGYTGHLPTDYFPFDNYSGVFHWLRVRGVLTGELIDGFVAFGEPFGNEDGPTECEFIGWRPPRPLPAAIP